MTTPFARRISRLSLLSACAVLAVQMAGSSAGAQTSSVYGPYNADLPRGGDGLTKPLAGGPLSARGPWSLQGWISPATASAGRVVVAGIGEPAGGGRFIVLEDGAPAVLTGTAIVKGSGALKPGVWTHVAAVSDGANVLLYVDGVKVGEGAVSTVAPAPVVQLGPRKPAGPDPALTVYETGSPNWPVQVRQMYGQVTPQEAWTRPKGKGAISAPVAKPAYAGPALVADGPEAWTFKRWSLVEAPKVAQDGATALSPRPPMTPRPGMPPPCPARC
jgi:hypothetical protein